MIKIDDRQLKNWSKDTKFKKPAQAKRAVKDVLNDMAFATRKQATKSTIPRFFQNRSRWLFASIYVTKADLKKQPLFSRVGALKTWKNQNRPFIGLRQQEFGEKINNPGIYSLFSRGGAFSGKVKPSLSGRKRGRAKKVTGSMGQVSAMLAKLQAEKYGGPIYIRTSKIRKGIYKFYGRLKTVHKMKKRKIRPIKMIQDFSRRSVRLKKRPWLKSAEKKAVNQSTIMRFYKKAYWKHTSKKGL